MKLKKFIAAFAYKGNFYNHLYVKKMPKFSMLALVNQQLKLTRLVDSIFVTVRLQESILYMIVYVYACTIHEYKTNRTQPL